MSNKLRVYGKIVTQRDWVQGTVTIDRTSGLIVDVMRGKHSMVDIDVRDCLVFPGFIDLHVHLRQDPSGEQCHKEDFITGGAASVNGGVVAVGSMGNTPMAPLTKSIYLDTMELARKSAVEVVLYGATAPGSRPFEGITVPYKAFLAESVGKTKFSSEAEAEETLRHYTGQHVSAHCDDNEILAACAHMTEHEDRRPISSEVKAVRFILGLQKKYGFHLKIVHVSGRESLLAIKQARQDSQTVVCEGTPQHSFMHRGKLTPENKRRWRMNPPMRDADDMFAVNEGFRDGSIDFLATDHAPHTLEEKGLLPHQLDDPNVKVASGTPQLDTYGNYVSLLLERGYGTDAIHRIACWNPGRWLTQFLPRNDRYGKGYGEIAPGYIGSLSILDVHTPELIEAKNLKTKCGWSPFEGFTFPGQVLHTIIRGEVLK